MGDFDKVQADAPGNDKRKQMLVGVLGLVLLVVVGFHFLKGSPEKAVASVADSRTNAGGPMGKESPKNELAKLDNDPTAAYLLGSVALDPQLAAAPHDPFRLPDKLAPKDVKPEVVVVTPPPVPAHVNEKAPTI